MSTMLMRHDDDAATTTMLTTAGRLPGLFAFSSPDWKQTSP
jgi:hypothetical protein